MKKVSIVGFGRFGKTLNRLLGEGFEVVVYDNRDVELSDEEKRRRVKVTKDLKEVYESEVVFYCVPISSFESVIEKHNRYFKDDQLLIDVLSVKIHPKKILAKYLKNKKTRALLTHPMFGPDSSKDGFGGLPIMVDRFLANDEEYAFWIDFFKRRELVVVEMSAEKHDKLAARSQGVTHLIGRALESIKFAPTEIDTWGAKRLHEVMNSTVNNSWELFLDLQRKNPYTGKMREEVDKSLSRLEEKISERREKNKTEVVIGIQGGKGSFNEQAILSYLNDKKIRGFKIKYLYTSAKVLAAVERREVDWGLFAIHNTLGGMVEESIAAMAWHRFKIIDQVKITIRHFLMKRKDVEIDKITTVMAHPQVLKQCKGNLEARWGLWKQVSGEGDLIDTAQAAKALAEGKIESTRAIVGPEGLVEMYDFDLIAQDLQDNKNNETTFLVVTA